MGIISALEHYDKLIQDARQVSIGANLFAGGVNTNPNYFGGAKLKQQCYSLIKIVNLIIPFEYIPPNRDNIMDNKQEFGPQYKYDKPFTARMRFHQSWYRGKILIFPLWYWTSEK